VTLLYYFKPLYHPRAGRDFPLPVPKPKRKKRRQVYQVVRPTGDVRDSKAIEVIQDIAQGLIADLKERKHAELLEAKAELETLRQTLQDEADVAIRAAELSALIAKYKAELELERKLKRQERELTELQMIDQLEEFLAFEELIEEQVYYEH